ncbi:hypothetical protein R1sor_025004 [Riccia sorocarpa]|uniref:Cilia- and flagella-associated protein 206 n=1 Tax=Riccia sorocarpa TaxID=122646 RepID=A0ABD3GAZ9_9MARC
MQKPVQILTLLPEPLPCDFGTQTCTHPLPIHRWDEETLLNRIEELKKLKTDSSQTNASHFHRDNDAQVWPPKDKWTQTPISRGTTVAHHVRVLHNLRGGIHETPKVIKATFEMHDTVNPL